MSLTIFPAQGGDVVGPASATDGHVALFDGATGKLLKNGGLPGGTGTVTSVSVVTANGFSGTVATATSTPAITIIAGDITPSKVNGMTITTNSGTLHVANAKSFDVLKSITIDGTDGTTPIMPSISGQVAIALWQIKTANFNAVSGLLYQCNTVGGTFNATLPAAPGIGDVIEFQDTSENWGSDHLVILRNGLLINGVADDYACNISGDKITATYISIPIGWSIK